uniref:C2H2-type domain-containing protein n=1 Tax=Athene cunicularia TaxID=194338 RepID=A0A663NEM6_ATHCN
MWYYKFIPSLLKQLLSYSSVNTHFKPLLNGKNGQSDFVQSLGMSLHKCRICQTVKANQLELEMHIREHRLGNHYKCDQCGYLSKTANKLIEHVRVHTGERPFHCDQCSYSCKRKDNLNLHKKLKHAPRQTFSCDECLSRNLLSPLSVMSASQSTHPHSRPNS